MFSPIQFLQKQQFAVIQSTEMNDNHSLIQGKAKEWRLSLLAEIAAALHCESAPICIAPASAKLGSVSWWY